MKKSLMSLALILIGVIGCSYQATPAVEVAQAVELFNKTMVKPDQAVFEQLTSPILTYGHSNGLIEDQKTCIASMVTGKFKFLSIDLSEQRILIEGNTAIVRHVFFAHTHDAGKEPGTVKLKVLQVWQKTGGTWRLLARQAVKSDD